MVLLILWLLLLLLFSLEGSDGVPGAVERAGFAFAPDDVFIVGAHKLGTPLGAAGRLVLVGLFRCVVVVLCASNTDGRLGSVD